MLQPISNHIGINKSQVDYEEHNLNRFEPKRESLTEFLVSLYTSGLGYSTIKTARSAVLVMKSTFSNYIYERNIPTGVTKGHTHTGCDCWLDLLKGIFTMKDLTLKLNILVFLTTGQREQTIFIMDITYKGYQMDTELQLKKSSNKLDQESV